ncbi:hypothetical protein ScPMuIL_007788 [Solemya velum]
MKWKKALAFLSIDVFWGAIGTALVQLIGEEQCNTQTWQEELYMYTCHQRKLEMCLSPTGEFQVGLQAVTGWIPYQTPLPLLTLMLILILVIPTMFSQMWKFAFSVVGMLFERLKKKKNFINPSAGCIVHRDVDIAFDFATMQNLMRTAGGKDVEVVFDYDVILELLKYADDEEVELLVDL